MLRLMMLAIESIKKLIKLQDTITIGLLSGFIGTIFMEISNLLIFRAGKTETLYGHIAGGLFVAPFRTNQRKNFILGEICHFVIGSFWGVPLTYILKKTGKDHHLLKGTFVSMISLGSLIWGQKVGLLKKFRLTKTFYSAYWNHLIYGLVSAQAIVSLADPIIFKSLNNKTEDFRQASDDYNFLTLMESSHDLKTSHRPGNTGRYKDRTSGHLRSNLLQGDT